jgi:hypothetical protein
MRVMPKARATMEMVRKNNTNALLDAIEHGSSFSQTYQSVECCIGDGSILQVQVQMCGFRFHVYLKKKNITELVDGDALYNAILLKVHEEAQEIITETVTERQTRVRAEIKAREPEIKALLEEDAAIQREAQFKLAYEKDRRPSPYSTFNDTKKDDV